MTKRVRRVGAALVALLLVVGGAADAAGAHDCPHHGGSPAAAQGDGHAGHADHAHGSGDESHGVCTCFGRCHAGEAPTLPSLDRGRVLPAPPAPPLSVPAPQPSLRPAIVPFTLPWGNAPPSL